MEFLNQFKKPGMGLFLLRLGVGAIFFMAGWGKMSNMEMTLGFFASLGVPALLTYLVVVIEILGGIAMLVGYKTDIAAVLLACVMVGAIVLVSGAKGFQAMRLDLILLLANLAILMEGPGKNAMGKM